MNDDDLKYALKMKGLPPLHEWERVKPDQLRHRLTGQVVDIVRPADRVVILTWPSSLDEPPERT